MAMTVQCNIVSAEREIFSGLVEMLIATGTLGDLGITYGFSSGINDEDVAVSFELYPNPTTKSLNIKLNETLNKDVILEAVEFEF